MGERKAKRKETRKKARSGPVERAQIIAKGARGQLIKETTVSGGKWKEKKHQDKRRDSREKAKRTARRTRKTQRSRARRSSTAATRRKENCQIRSTTTANLGQRRADLKTGACYRARARTAKETASRAANFGTTGKTGR